MNKCCDYDKLYTTEALGGIIYLCTEHYRQNQRELNMDIKKNGAKHLDEGKIGLQYVLAMPGLLEVAKVGDYGGAKYGDQFNYKKGMPWMKLLGSCARHLAAVCRGEDRDEESKLLHLAHMVYDGLMLLDYWINGMGTDDRYKKVYESDTSHDDIPF